MTEGDVLIEEAIPEHNRPLISKLTEMGAVIREERGGLRVIGPKVIKPTDIKTMPHPGFPTDMQAQMTAIQMVADGSSVVTETVFENRFQHLEEMQRMNADVKMDGNIAIINGSQALQGGCCRGNRFTCVHCIDFSWITCSRYYARITLRIFRSRLL